MMHGAYSIKLLLRMLLLCIASTYLDSVLSYKFLILDICHPDTIDMSKDVGVYGYGLKSKGVREQKNLGKH